MALFLYCIRRKWINCCTILLKSFSAIAETVRRFHAIVADGHIGRVRCLRRSLSKVKDLQKHSHNFQSSTGCRLLLNPPSRSFHYNYIPVTILSVSARTGCSIVRVLHSRLLSGARKKVGRRDGDYRAKESGCE